VEVAYFKAVFERLILGTEKTTENYSEHTLSAVRISKLRPPIYEPAMIYYTVDFGTEYYVYIK
jgi:hypothetical protein